MLRAVCPATDASAPVWASTSVEHVVAQAVDEVLGLRATTATSAGSRG